MADELPHGDAVKLMRLRYLTATLWAFASYSAADRYEDTMQSERQPQRPSRRRP